MRLARELRSRLKYKIILPFLLLTLIVALAGSAVALTLVASSLQDRFDNQLAQVARGASDSIVWQEQSNLQFLREVVFAPPNPETGTPAVASALSLGDSAGLQAAIDPYFRSGAIREDLLLDRLIIFDRNGVTLLDWEQPRSRDDEERIAHAPSDLSQQWFVQSVLASTQDNLGDKFAGLIKFEDAGNYLFTVAPIHVDGQVVGGALVARRLDGLLRTLRNRTQADIVAVYDTGGQALQSTFEPNDGLKALALDRTLAERLIVSQTDPDLPEEEQLDAVYTVPVNQRDYQFAYSVLKVRNSVVGMIGVALARDYVVGPWATAYWPIASVTIVLMLAIIGLGIVVARTITRPLVELVATAEAVTAGNFLRRSHVDVRDEIGLLSDSFNTMTDYLVQMYGSVQAEASRSAAIVDSIADGVIVCDSEGQILVANAAARQMVTRSGARDFPASYEALPLELLTDDNHPFGVAQSANLRMLGDRVVRLNVAPVIVSSIRLGDVYVLQDLTAEAAVDRARSNFIATISHEMRTPLTVLRGYIDLMLRGLAGKLNDEQSQMLETMRVQMNNMTGLINNVIVIAGLDSGSLQTYLERVELANVLDEALWQVRGPLSAKGLEIILELPGDLPPILADRDQLRQVLVQLLDNARRYTHAGTVTVRARAYDGVVQVDIGDTGCGIHPELQPQIFDRFIRGEEGINSPERGIGLGLAIVRQLIERHGGNIWVESERGRGSVFSFTLRQSNESPDHDTGNNPASLAAAA